MTQLSLDCEGSSLDFNFEFITPKHAQGLLAKNHENNRKLNPLIVDSYARQMLKGLWKPENAEGIRVCTDDTIIDGQHRLAAIIQAFEMDRKFKGITLLIIRNVPPEVIRSLDSGYQRTFLHAFHIEGRGVICESKILSAVRAMFNLSKAIEYGKSYEIARRAIRPSNAELLMFLDSLPGFVESCLHFFETFQYNKVFKTINASTALMIYHIYKDDEDAIFSFFKTFETGIPFDGLKEKSPTYHFYQNMITNREVGVVMQPGDYLMMFFWTYSAMKDGQQVRTMPKRFEWEIDAKNPVHDKLLKFFMRLT